MITVSHNLAVNVRARHVSHRPHSDPYVHALGGDDVHQREGDGPGEECVANVPPKDEDHEHDTDDASERVPRRDGGGFLCLGLGLVGVGCHCLEDEAEGDGDQEGDGVACFGGFEVEGAGFVGVWGLGTEGSREMAW